LSPLNVRRIQVGEAEKAGSQPIPELRKAKVAHKSVAVGSAFEQLSISDKLLLTATAIVVEPETDDTVSPTRRWMTIGVTAGENWDERQEKTADFLRVHHGIFKACEEFPHPSRALTGLAKRGFPCGLGLR
jgi:hypothetical protein